MRNCLTVYGCSHAEATSTTKANIVSAIKSGLGSRICSQPAPIISCCSRPMVVAASAHATLLSRGGCSQQHLRAATLIQKPLMIQQRVHARASAAAQLQLHSSVLAGGAGFHAVHELA